ncbi:hypothetical protein J6590_025991 [Homalodisca vitripennis]|nr:hypothetical protein J6590_025991 [Homalodisca vitripennis]
MSGSSFTMLDPYQKEHWNSGKASINVVLQNSGVTTNLRLGSQNMAQFQHCTGPRSCGVVCPLPLTTYRSCTLKSQCGDRLRHLLRSADVGTHTASDSASKDITRSSHSLCCIWVCLPRRAETLAFLQENRALAFCRRQNLILRRGTKSAEQNLQGVSQVSMTMLLAGHNPTCTAQPVLGLFITLPSAAMPVVHRIYYGCPCTFC